MIRILTNIAEYASVFFVIFSITWLYHREIKKTTGRGGTAEKSLEKERDLLERRVAERTEELVAMEREKMEHRANMARFGELSRGLFHDLMSPLSSLSLYLEKMATTDQASGETRKNMEKIVGISRRMNSFMDSVKRSLGKPGDPANTIDTGTVREIEIARDVLAYKARMAGVEIIIERSDAILLPLHPVRFHQLIVNLISNGIEACASPDKHQGKKGKRVIIEAKKENGVVAISVSDNGCGISADRIPTILKNPVSTKTGGTGIGLMTVRSIVENELHGKIEVKSEVGRGTVFSILIPHK